MLKTLRAALLRYTITRQTARREQAQREVRHYRDLERDAKAKRADAQSRIDDAERELASIERRRTVARLARATV